MARSPAEAISARAAPVERPRRISGLWLWAPLALAGAYLIALLVQFQQIVAATYLDADAASAPVIGQLYGGSPPHREVVLGQMAWFSTLMFELATRWLPLHRQIWEAAPYAMALASAALIAWGLWRIAGRWAAMIGGTLVVCAAPHTLHLLFSLNDHSPTWFSLALLGALLVIAERSAGELGVLRSTLLAVAVGAIVGANMASDTLLIGAGAVPALLAVATASVLPGAGVGRPALRLVLATTAVAAVAAVLTRLLMHHENVTVPANITHTGLASAEAVTSNFKLWWQSIAVLGNGEFFGQSLGFTAGLQVMCAGLALLVVIVLVPRIAWRELMGALGVRARDGQADANERRPAPSAAGAQAAASGFDERAPRLAWCIFWGSSAFLLSIGFIVSSTPVDINSDRYLVGLIYAAAALVPLLAGASIVRRAAISAGAAVFAVTGLITLAQGQPTANVTNAPSGYVAGQVARIAAREHLTVGYAGYWDAAPLTWETHFRVKVYPVQACGASLCSFGIHYISSWYKPHPGLRTFLISDPATSVPAPAVPELGPPSAVHHIARLTMYVYPYDIAGKLHEPPSG